ncbi:MAG: hypothetical protein II888_04000 [Clostridia bacterium]|nr:hypothetical protein [Clostridia bacterium]
MKKLVSILLAAVLCLTAAASVAEGIKMGHVLAAAHGAQCFAEVTVAMDGDKIVGVYIDEYQYMDPTQEGVVPVPNSEGMANNVKEGVVLASKKESNSYYSGLMAKVAGSTTEIAANYAAIEAFCTGKTVSELKAEMEGKDAAAAVDAVSGATLADTANYIAAVIAAAESVQ